MKKFLSIFLLLLIGFSIFCFFENQKSADGRLHVVFCNVGQGDGIYIKTPNGADILLDGGPDDSMLSCMQRHMPLWNRDVELMLLSHPHFDHFGGFIDVLKRYSVLQLGNEKLSNMSTSYAAFTTMVSTQHIPTRSEFAKDTMKFADGTVFTILGPSKNLLTLSSPTGEITGATEQVTLVLQLTYGSFDVLLTGDSQVNGMEEAIAQIDKKSTIEVLKVPHHGSKTGLSDAILQELKPALAVISVGTHNKYGHPAPYILKLLQKHNIKTLRTDKNGDIEVVSDGKRWWIR
jgi:competence protein ComEC